MGSGVGVADAPHNGGSHCGKGGKAGRSQPVITMSNKLTINRGSKDFSLLAAEERLKSLLPLVDVGIDKRVIGGGIH